MSAQDWGFVINGACVVLSFLLLVYVLSGGGR